MSFISQLKPLFKDVFLCKMDKDVIPVPMVYGTAMDTADQIKSLEILKAKEFIKIISIDDYGKLREKFFLNNSEHDNLNNNEQFNQQSCSCKNITSEESLKNISKKLEKIYEMMSYKMLKRI